MQSKTQKIIKLLQSKDDDTIKLALKTIETLISKKNVIFWHLTLNEIVQNEVFILIPDSLTDKINNIFRDYFLVRSQWNHAMKDLTTFVVNNDETDVKSIIKLHEKHELHYMQFLLGNKPANIKQEVYEHKRITTRSDQDM